MIYDPSRSAQELRRRILESMTAEEIEECAKTHPPVENRKTCEEGIAEPDEKQPS